MKKTDRVLIGIVGGIILLVVVAFVVALTRPEPEYQPEDTPGGVAFNYLFALQQKDYERAYGYLSPAVAGYPRDVDVFTDDLRDYSWQFSGAYDSSVSLEVDSVDVNGNRADVVIRETRFYEGDLFSSNQYTNTYTMTLRQEAHGDWKITDSDNYWLWCWNETEGCN